MLFFHTCTGKSPPKERKDWHLPRKIYILNCDQIWTFKIQIDSVFSSKTPRLYITNSAIYYSIVVLEWNFSTHNSCKWGWFYTGSLWWFALALQAQENHHPHPMQNHPHFHSFVHAKILHYTTHSDNALTCNSYGPITLQYLVHPQCS